MRLAITSLVGLFGSSVLGAVVTTTKTITESPGCYVYAYSTTSTLTVPAVTKTVTAAPGKTMTTTEALIEVSLTGVSWTDVFYTPAPTPYTPVDPQGSTSTDIQYDYTCQHPTRTYTYGAVKTVFAGTTTVTAYAATSTVSAIQTTYTFWSRRGLAAEPTAAA